MPEARKYASGRIFDEPASYQICVLGALEESWSDCLGGMAVLTGEVITHKSLLLWGRDVEQ